MRRTLPCCHAAVGRVRRGRRGAAPPKEAPTPADISDVKDKLTVWTDGKKHYLALQLTTDTDTPVFWSADGKAFYHAAHLRRRLRGRRQRS